MELFRGKRERSVLNPRDADIKWNSPMYTVYFHVASDRPINTQ